MKTLGFPTGAVLGFVLAEAFALCLFGGLGGLALATMLGAMVEKAVADQFQLASMPGCGLSGSRPSWLMSVAVGLLRAACAAPENRRCTGRTPSPKRARRSQAC